MSKSSVHSVIRLRGIRHNNLKNFDLDLPLNRLIVVTGLSGSGKSSLAFDTLFAEGQRRYIETFSPYARQFFDRMDKPQADRIEGIPPAIAIEQRNSVKSSRSTVGTMTEICDYVRLLWPQIARLHCRQCGRLVRKDSPRQIWQFLGLESEKAARDRRDVRHSDGGGTDNKRKSPAFEALITFELPLTDRLSLEESLGLVTKQGYQRLLLRTAPLQSGPESSRGQGRDLEIESLVQVRELVPVSADVLDERAAMSVEKQTGSESTLQSRADVSGSEMSFAAASLAVELNEAKAPWGDETGRSRVFELIRVDEAMARLKDLKPRSLTVVQDRIRLTAENRARFVEACEQAYHFGKGRLAIFDHVDSFVARQSAFGVPRFFSNRLHCAHCDIEYREPTPALFSFNHPVGACPACRGFGRIITIDYNLAIPDRSKSLEQGTVKPWQSGVSAECQDDLMTFCKRRRVPTNVPFEKLSKKWQDWVIDGDPGYGKDKAHEWPRAWYGVKGYFRWLESKSYKMHVRVLLSRYRSYSPCPDCRGKRFQPETLLYRLDGVETDGTSIGSSANGHTIADFYQLPVRDALRFIERLAVGHESKATDPLGLVLREVRSRLAYLVEVGLGYLTLDRPTRTLSGGETERVNLTTCLGTRLVNTLYVLDEPSVGLHARDTGRLIRILGELRDLGNTVVVVEHEASVIRAADQVVDIGPGHGESGGQIVYQGNLTGLMKSRESLTGQYLSGRRKIKIPKRRPVVTERIRGKFKSGVNDQERWLTVHGASLHNLKNLTVDIPLGRFVCVTGVSGSGKTTLIREVLLPVLRTRPESSSRNPSEGADNDGNRNPGNGESRAGDPGLPKISGLEHLGRVVPVDQALLGKTPRSNPAVYVGAFDDIRELFAQSEIAKQRGLNASAFSFNSSQGQCERCRGAGFEKIEMQFLSDVFIRCPDCNGRRYRPHILEVKVGPQSTAVVVRKRDQRKTTDHAPRTTEKLLSIADVLDATVDEAIGFLDSLNDSRHARRALARLRLLQEVGLGYLRLGQPINTLSGGESQRLKLVSHLAEVNLSMQDGKASASSGDAAGDRPADLPKPILFLFDEPTTGLHFDDVRVLINVFQRLVDAGHSVVVIEHNLDLIKCADWVIDLGPDAGDRGGQLVACGTPEQIATCDQSHTGRFLREVL